MRRRWLTTWFVLGTVIASPAAAAPIHEQTVRLDGVRVMQVMLSPSTGTGEVSFTRRGACPPEVVAHTDATFEPGQYIVQAGFAEDEAAGAAWELPESAFPVHFVSAEILFATANATTQTTTEWSVDIWQGKPGAGSVIASFASDGTVLPHLVMPPGTTGTILQILVDPSDPEQIWIDNNGTNTYSVSFRVEAHHSPGFPCIEPPDSALNAFPTTDLSGLASPQGNLIDAVPGSFCVCGSGWITFQELPSICTPSGDWVLRSTYIPNECAGAEAACCLPDTSCVLDTQINCEVLGGDWIGEGVDCPDIACEAPTGACCVPSTGACADVDQVTCAAFGGIFNPGTNCDAHTCFPEGACCTQMGDCVGPMAPDACEGLGGLFMGDDTSCADVTCPAPTGWCCAPDGSFCVEQTEEICDAFGATWGGAGSTCDDLDACGATCPGDVDGSGAIDVDDILIVLSNWEGAGDGDADGDGDVDVDDLLMVIGNFGPC